MMVPFIDKLVIIYLTPIHSINQPNFGSNPLCHGRFQVEKRRSKYAMISPSTTTITSHLNIKPSSTLHQPNFCYNPLSLASQVREGERKKKPNPCTFVYFLNLLIKTVKNYTDSYFLLYTGTGCQFVLCLEILKIKILKLYLYWKFFRFKVR